MSCWFLGKVVRALWCKQSARQCQLAGYHRSNKTERDTVWDFTISLVMDRTRQPNSEIISMLFHSSSQTFICREDISVLTQEARHGENQEPHFLCSIACFQYSLPPSLLSPISIFLSLVSLSLSLYLSIFPSHSLISTQACYTRVQASRRESDRVGERGREREKEGEWAVEGNGSQAP